MSTDENTTASEDSTSQETTTAQDTQPSLNASLESGKNTAENLLGQALGLKESNPKVFFGAIGAVLILVILMFSGGGSSAKLPVHQSKAVVVGQSYVLKSPNAYDAQATIRLVSVPGSMAAYDDTEEADREGACKHITQGTPVKVTQSQDAYGKKDVFAEVEMTTGECEGRKGWTLSVNLQ
jgi:hypothetical protein